MLEAAVGSRTDVSRRRSQIEKATGSATRTPEQARVWPLDRSVVDPERDVRVLVTADGVDASEPDAA
jgi:hypothetical protein